MPGPSLIHLSLVAEDILLAEQAPAFVCDPLVPAEGVTFIHGPKSVGKSPFIWTLARAVASGGRFLGMPTRQGRVLVVEIDSPKSAVQRRYKLIPDVPQGWFTLWGAAFNIFRTEHPLCAAMLEAAQKIDPNLVILNTLRKAHPYDDKESQVPSQFYRRFEELFPGAARIVVHHDRKPSAEANTPDHAQSGSEAWRNDAQSVIHLEKAGKGRMKVSHTASQVSECLEPFTVYFVEGNSLIGLHNERDEMIVRVFQATEGSSGRQKAEAAAKTLAEMGIELSPVRVRNIVAEMTQGEDGSEGEKIGDPL